ncbi:MAG: hypothetical protein IJB92_08180, partial [Clostridia bacterium]|nr:hypothetical protein [Clostridia bacterium]
MSKRFVSLITLVAMLLCLMAPATAMAAVSVGTPTVSDITESSATINVAYSFESTDNLTAVSIHYGTDSTLASATGLRLIDN